MTDKLTLDNACDKKYRLNNSFQRGGYQADWQTFDEVVGAYVKDFKTSKYIPKERQWNICCEFMAVVLSDLWEGVE